MFSVERRRAVLSLVRTSQAPAENDLALFVVCHFALVPGDERDRSPIRVRYIPLFLVRTQSSRRVLCLLDWEPHVAEELAGAGVEPLREEAIDEVVPA